MGRRSQHRDGQNKNTSPKWQLVGKKVDTTDDYITRQKKQNIWINAPILIIIGKGGPQILKDNQAQSIRKIGA